MNSSAPTPLVNIRRKYPNYTSMLYQSCQLPSGSKCIRVLDILPTSSSAPNPDSEPIKCNLRVISLENQPKFTALSYVWGIYSPVPDFISCNSIQVKVTNNCYLALRYLRKKLGKLTIWLDAVCINQDDQHEKSRQISLMGEIYSLADCVYVWLGEGTTATDRAMEYMANAGLQRYYKTTEKGVISRRYAAACSLYFSRFCIKCNPIPFSEAATFYKPNYWGRYTTSKDLKDLLSRTWITRLWTYQEILLASNPVVVCGDAHVPWFSFEKSIFLLYNIYSFNPEGMTTSWASVALGRERLQKSAVGLKISGSSALKDYSIFVQEVSRVLRLLLYAQGVVYALNLVCFVAMFSSFPFRSQKKRFEVLLTVTTLNILIIIPTIYSVAKNRGRKSYAAQKSHPPNEELIFGLYSRTAKDPRDMAFGMWAILEREGAVQLPEPNYTHDIGDIYRSLTVQLIHITQSPDLLLLAAVRSIPGQPSWVPDWSAHRQHEWGNNVGQLSATSDYVDHEIRERHSSKAKFEVKPSTNSRSNKPHAVLTVNARQICEIIFCFRFQSTSEQFERSERDIHMKNLRLMLLWASWEPELRDGPIPYDPNAPYFPRNLLNTARIQQNSAFLGLNAKHVKLWVSFCNKNHSKNITDVFSLLCNNSDILVIQIAVCNRLASHEIVPFYSRNAKKPGKPILGSCSRKTQVGDQVLRVDGVPEALIARRQSAEKNVKIISPAIIFTTLNGKRLDYIYKENSEPGFAEYQIC